MATWEGAGSGAVAGAGIGSVVPVVGTAAGAIIGGIIGGLTGKKRPKRPKPTTIDLSAELAKLDALYAEQKAGVTASMGRQLAQTQAQTSDSLAGRGVYSSPVSEYSFGVNRAASANALADALAMISGQQAGTRAQLTSGLSQLQAKQIYEAVMSEYEAKIRNRNILSSALTGLGTAGLTKWAGGLGKAPAVVPSVAPSAANLSDYTQPIDRPFRF